MSWKELDKGEAIAAGTPYRSRYTFSLAFSDTIAKAAAAAVMGARPVLSLAGIHVQKVELLKPDQVTQTPGGRYKRWQLLVYWNRKG